ncbi:helix-turn-helix domain-containing protein [Tsukamurella pseudospumae]|uniref:XRE family transcriptional regulator n=1 Tax=Tsukamurella pseudospumae TaxID=239498 RepID=A0A138A176_9ACTN|nr:XRE family transcriptional regulator [Tsukamurella pseudospumae]KXO89429.1 XRE family transcriptional regulator [Tsukamurella pseudospumae]KXP04182.1 XRE family transcriptional regulator [Tsukamurella pseudospumae]
MVTTADPWEVIADTPEEAENLRLRSDLMIAIEQAIRSHGWSQKQAAKHLSITAPRMNDLLRGKIDKFSLDALVNLGAKLDLHLRITHVA